MPTESIRRSVTGSRFLAVLLLFVLSALAPTFAHATAGEGVVVSWPDGTRESLRPDPQLEALAFGTDPEPQLHLVDVSRATLPATVIDFELDAFRPLQLAVYDLEGRLVCQLAEGLYAAGSHRMAWHHENQDGEILKRGLYVVRLTTGPAHGEHLVLSR
jgi:hypothetical protein